LPRGNASIGEREGMKVTIVPMETVVMDSESGSFCCEREGMKVTIVPMETVVIEIREEKTSVYDL
jgi:hypothetical protein